MVMSNMASRSRFIRRLHRIADLFLTLFLQLGDYWKLLNEERPLGVLFVPI